MNNIAGLFASMPDQGLPARQVSEYMKFAQSEAFFHLAVAKDARVALVKQCFSKRTPQKIFLSANLAGFGCKVEGADVTILEKNYFQEPDSARRTAKLSELKNSIVIVNNNDVGTPEARIAYAEFFGECTSTLFLAWDWDNHHWLELSTFLAAHSDIYAPAHHENLYLLSRYNWLIAGPVYCSSVQWDRKFLTDHLSDMLVVERSSSPLGMHIPYSQFNFRIQVISTLNKHFSSIGFSNRTFHVRSMEDRLTEWYSHKSHWVAPVLNDVPIRIFDALVTGGIPIVPSSLRFLPPVNAIPEEHIVFYTPSDIVNPEALVARANGLFDRGSRDGIVARHRLGLDKYHGDNSINQMLKYAAALLVADAAT